MAKIYLDTNIYLDFLLERKNTSQKDLSSPSFQVFKRTILCEFTIIVSDKVLYELRANMDPDKVKVLFELIQNKTVKIKTEPNDIKEAKKLPTHFADALHVVLAKKAEADFLVTRNLKHFKHLFNTKLPEDV